MKTVVDKLRDLPREKLILMIKYQKSEIGIMQRDLKTMEDILKESKP